MSWTEIRTIGAPAGDVLELLTDPEAAGRWSPVPFEVEELDADRLEAGAHGRIAGTLAGVRVGIDLEVHAADEELLDLSAHGPVDLDVRYELVALAPDATEVHASVDVHGRGLTGRVLARATNALLGAGALGAALGRIADEAESLVGV